MSSKRIVVLIFAFSALYLGGIFLAFFFGILNLQVTIPFIILDFPFAVALAIMDRELKRDTTAIENALSGTKILLNSAYSKISATIEDVLAFRVAENTTDVKMDGESLNYIHRKLNEISSVQMNYEILPKIVLTKREINSFVRSFYNEVENLRNILSGAEKQTKYDFFNNVKKCKDNIELAANSLRISGLLSNEGPHRVVDDSDVKSWGWEPKRLLDELIKLDYETMVGLTHDMEGSTAQWADVFSESPDTWRLLVNGSESIIGYWRFVPLFSQDFQKAKSGSLMDNEITAERIMPLDRPGNYDIYFVSIVLRRGYRNHEDRALLFGSLFEVLYLLAKDGIFIREIVTDAYTSDGERTCTNFGMIEVTKHIEHGKIFQRTLYPFYAEDRFAPRDTEIRELYTKHFGDENTM